MSHSSFTKQESKLAQIIPSTMQFIHVYARA